ncbi:MAG: PAS domain-containing protein [Myxococcota bacterium]
MRYDPDELPPMRESEMATRMRAVDWSKSVFGPASGWPQALRLAVGICLDSRFPMFVWWGPDRINLYNDAYIPILGSRHPAALAQPAQEVWPEIWDVIGPQADAVMQRGEATWNERVHLRMERNGFAEDTWFTWSYSAIRDEQGKIVGLFCACAEHTAEVLLERERDRLAVQNRQAEEHARNILQSITDAFFGLDREWRFTYVNLRAQQVLGRSDLVGQVLWDAYPGARGSEFERMYLRTANERIPASFTSFYPDHQRWYEVRSYPAPDGIAVYFRDTTEQHRLAEEREQLARRLAAEVDRFDLVLSWISDFAYTFDLEGRFTFANKALLDLWGLPLEQAIGKNFFDLGYPPELAERLQREIQHVIHTRERVVGETPYTSPAGEPGEYQYIFSAILDRDGRVEQVAGSTRDISALVRSEHALRASEAATERERRLYHAILGNTPDLAYVFDLNHRFIYANEVLLATWGKTLAEAIGKTCLELGYESWHAQMHDREIEQVIATKAPIRGEVPFTGTGGRRMYDYIMVPVLGRDGEVEAVAGTTRDVTDRHEGEKEREQLLSSERAARNEAERAGRVKDEFLATLSHELRTPLTAIHGWAQILSRRAPTPETLARGLAVIERNARVQTQLIADMLDMSSIISGKMRLDVQDVELPLVIESALDAVRPAAQARGVALETEVPDDTGPVRADPARLQQVVWNLLSNAVKFTPRGGRVVVGLGRVESHVEISVRDTGKGIQAAFLPHVFERFRQADSSASREHGGLGLGLAIVKQLVEVHGGTVAVISEGEGLGSTFTVALPLAENLHGIAPSNPASRGMTGHVPSAIAAPDLEGVRVLVVDDDPDTRDMVRRLLEECAAKVVVAASAQDALDVVAEGGVDVIVSDLGMPGYDGFEMMLELRRRGVGVPAAALTAFAREEDRSRALRSGYQAHLVKPVEPAELLATVAALARTL